MRNGDGDTTAIINTERGEEYIVFAYKTAPNTTQVWKQTQRSDKRIYVCIFVNYKK